MDSSRAPARSFRSVGVFGLLACALISGCVELPYKAPSGDQQSPYVRVHVSDPDAFFSNEGTNVELWLSPMELPWGPFSAGIELPPGVEVLGGNVTLDGWIGPKDGNPTLAYNTPAQTLSATIRAEARSDYVLRGWFWDSRQTAVAHNVGLRPMVFGAETFDPGPTNVNLSLAVLADPEDVRRVTAVGRAPLSMDVYLTHGSGRLQLLNETDPGPRLLRIGPETPWIHEYEVEIQEFPLEDGWVATFQLELIPDPRLADNTPSDYLFYRVENGTLTATKEGWVQSKPGSEPGSG